MDNKKNYSFLMRNKLPPAIEKFISAPENLEEQLTPIIEKLERLKLSPLLSHIRNRPNRNDLHSSLHEEIEHFLKFIDAMPCSYLEDKPGSPLYLLRYGDFDASDRVTLYAGIVDELHKTLKQTIRQKYETAIVQIMKYGQKDSSQDWVSSRQIPDPPLILSALPAQLLHSLSLEGNMTLSELSLEKVQSIAHKLAIEVAQTCS